MKKILIIGQAPPAQKQEVPYDTTMLYEWLQECGISKEQAQDMFDFEAVSNKFPGHALGGGHAKPSRKDMDDHFETTLKKKLEEADKVIILGNVAKDYIESKHNQFMVKITSSRLILMHPSRMNFNRYNTNKNKIIQPLKTFLHGKL